MYSEFQLAKKYIHYCLTASNGKGHGIHSPFIYDFVKNVLNDTTNYDAYTEVEALRRQLLKTETILEVQDMGAGSGTSKSSKRKVADIARYAAKPRKFAQLLFRIVKHYRPQTIIELGTSLGLTTAYLALADKNASVTSLEGASKVADLAKKNFERLQIANIRLVEGNFDDGLSKVLEEIVNLDFAFVDGNHRKAPTLRYFNELSARIYNSSIVIFDDIHWSEEMEGAWEIIKSAENVKLTVDLFYLGLVFLEMNLKQNSISKSAIKCKS